MKKIGGGSVSEKMQRAELVILSLIIFAGCNRAHIPNTNTVQSNRSFQLGGKWYFARMEGYGIPFDSLNFVNDSIVTENEENHSYRIHGDSITVKYDLGLESRKIKVTKDSLSFESWNSTDYYCRTPFDWDSSKLGSQILGVWWGDTDLPTAAMQVEPGVIQLPDPMYSTRATLKGNILTEYGEQNSLFIDTIEIPSKDTLVLKNGFGTVILHRNHDSD